MRDRLTVLLKKLNLSQKAFGDHIGMRASSVSDWLNPSKKSTPGFDSLKRIVDRFGVNPRWLLTGDGPMFIEEPIPVSEEGCQVLRVESEIAAGPPVEASECPLQYLSIGRSIIPDVSLVYCFQVNGRSMEPDVLHGDLVVIHRTSNWSGTEGKICAVRVDGEVTLKRVMHDISNKLLILAASNRDYSPIATDPESSSVELIGQLKTIIRNFR